MQSRRYGRHWDAAQDRRSCRNYGVHTALADVRLVKSATGLKRRALGDSLNSATGYTPIHDSLSVTGHAQTVVAYSAHATSRQ